MLYIVSIQVLFYLYNNTGGEKMADYEDIEVFDNAIETYIQEYCDQCHPPVEDLSKEPQNKWSAALMYVYNHMFRGTDKLKLDRPYEQYNNPELPRFNTTNCNAYDIDKINAVCDIYIYLCGMYDKEVSISGFSKLTGIDYSTICIWNSRKDNDELSYRRFKIYQKLHYEREESLCNKLITGGKNQVGIIAILNRHYGYASPYTADSKKQVEQKTAAELPRLDTTPQDVVAIESKDY